ncbi:MAG: hypothetical protein LRY73_01625 [Bacillus sp. (in: Bacteria)]|nr:hypothetical protein [Bacillus sp. (in: firmicutes)]
MFFQAISLISIINALIIGGFIVYAFYRTLDWLAGVPEPYLVIFAFLLPLFIGGILYPHYQYMIIPGILLGSGVGTVLEALKIRINPVRLTFFQRSCAIIIGSTGILILLYGIDLFANVTIIHTFILGSLIGGWITFFMPMLLVVLNIYPTETRTKMY